MAIIMYSVPQQHGIGEKHIYFLKRQKQLHLSDARMDNETPSPKTHTPTF